MTRALALAPLLFALALSNAGCGASTMGAEPPPKAGEGVEGQKPLTEIDALEQELSVSERRLEAELLRREEVLADSRAREGEADASKKGESRGSPPAQKPAEASDEDEKPQPRPRDAAPAPPSPPVPEPPVRSGSLATPCDIACRALSSMKKSADRICELAGTGDERCTRARTRVSAAEQRIRRAQCECVSEGEQKLSAWQPYLGAGQPSSLRSAARAVDCRRFVGGDVL